LIANTSARLLFSSPVYATLAPFGDQAGSDSSVESSFVTFSQPLPSELMT